MPEVDAGEEGYFLIDVELGDCVFDSYVEHFAASHGEGGRGWEENFEQKENEAGDGGGK